MSWSSTYTPEAGWSGWSAGAQAPMFSAGVQFGLSVFEGMQARRSKRDGAWRVLFAQAHAARLAASAETLGLRAPKLSHLEQGLARAVGALVSEGRVTGRIYLRAVLFSGAEDIFPASAPPFICAVFAREVPLPSAPQPIGLRADRAYVRAMQGSALGRSKAAVNYTRLVELDREAPLSPGEQRVWLSPGPDPRVEELDTMSLGLVMRDGGVAVPRASDSMLPGITMKMLVERLRASGQRVETCSLSLDTLVDLLETGEIAAVFATSTGKGLAYADRLVLADGTRALRPDPKVIQGRWSAYQGVVTDAAAAREVCHVA